MNRSFVSSVRTMALCAVVAFAATGCANLPAPVTYSPASTMSATGSVTVSDFKYLPAAGGKIAPNQLRNTAIGEIKLDKNIDVFFRDAVFKEFRFVGIKVDGNGRVLKGEIKEFLVDDLGYSVTWTVDVHYVVTDAQSGSVVYDGEKKTTNKTAKFSNVFEALNQQIRSNIEELLKDPEFRKSIN